MTTDPEDFARALPHDIHAEQCALGAMMLSKTALAECLEILSAEAFYRPAHQVTFEAIARLAEQGTPADAVTVHAELVKAGTIQALDSPLYLHDLLAAVPVASNGRHYAGIVCEKWTLRQAIETGMRIVQRGYAGDAEADEILGAALEDLTNAAEAVSREGTATAASLILPLVSSLEEGPDSVPGVPSGWADLNSYVPGFRPGEVTVVGGRPGQGKSIALLNVAAHSVLRDHLNVLAVTLEMSAAEYMERLLAAEANVSLTRIRERSVTDDDWDRIAKAHAVLAEAEGLRIHEGPDMTVRSIEAELRAMRREGRPADLLVIDYLQLLETSAARESRQLEVSGMSRSLKLLAKRWQIPVLVGSQLNRGPELRNDHHPVLADLRESGAVENDADIVILLYRDEAYYPESPKTGEVEFIIAKNRQGRLGWASLAFRGEVASISDMYREPGPAWSPSSSLDKAGAA